MARTVPHVTAEQAELVLAAIIAQHAEYLLPFTIPAHDADDYGPAEPAITYGPTITTPPVLIEDFDGHNYAVMWEEGPSEWSYRVNDGGHTEEERCLLGDAAAEFGATLDLTAGGPAPATIPPGVHVEAINHYSVGIYPA